MRLDYLLKRIGVFFLIVWLATTVNFFLPRISGSSPIRDKLVQEIMLGGPMQAGMEEMIKEYDAKFGLDKPLHEQYFNYIGDTLRLDLNYSISNYPRKVKDVIGDALPWTIGLLVTALLLSVIIGTIVGALLGWPRAPGWIKWIFPPIITLHAIPFYLLGLVLMYVLAFQMRWFPIFGGYTPGVPHDSTLAFALDVLHHAFLPALCIVLSSIGGWALGMRGMMITTAGEDYMVFGQAKGLKESTLFFHYGIRNALLPQVTHLALSLGHIVSGAVLVELVFAYPGVGLVLYNAIRISDFYLIQGIVFCVIVTLGLTTLVLDLLYPFLDPRITYRRA